MNVLINHHHQGSWNHLHSLNNMNRVDDVEPMMLERIQGDLRKQTSPPPSTSSLERKTKQQGRVVVSSYTKRDILSGRGGLANKHFGNKVYRRLIKHNKDLYRRLKSKRKQDLLIKSILLAVESQGGRFLKEDKASNTWYQIDDKEAWTKTSQALREPDKKSGDEESESGQSSDMSSSDNRPIPVPVKLVRQFTTDNPPNADRRIFDQVQGDFDYEDDNNDNDEEQVSAEAVAPTLLEMSTSTFSLGEKMNNSNSQRRPQEISVPTPQRQQPYHYSNDFSLPPSLSRDNTAVIAQHALGMRPIHSTSFDFPKLSPAPLMRSETLETFVMGNLTAGSVNAPAPAQPFGPPLLRFSSSAFMHGLDDVVFQRRESSASVDFPSYMGGPSSGGNGIAPV